LGRQAGRRVPGERHRHGPFLPPGAGAFVPGRYWRGCVGYRSGSWTGLGLVSWDFWDLGRERGDSRASGEFRVSPVYQPILPACVCVCGVRPWPACHASLPVMSAPVRTSSDGMGFVASFSVWPVPIRLRNMAMGSWHRPTSRQAPIILASISCHVNSKIVTSNRLCCPSGTPTRLPAAGTSLVVPYPPRQWDF